MCWADFRSGCQGWSAHTCQSLDQEAASSGPPLPTANRYLLLLKSIIGEKNKTIRVVLKRLLRQSTSQIEFWNAKIEMERTGIFQTDRRVLLSRRILMTLSKCLRMPSEVSLWYRVKRTIGMLDLQKTDEDSENKLPNFAKLSPAAMIAAPFLSILSFQIYYLKPLGKEECLCRIAILPEGHCARQKHGTFRALEREWWSSGSRWSPRCCCRRIFLAWGSAVSRAPRQWRTPRAWSVAGCRPWTESRRWCAASPA